MEQVALRVPSAPIKKLWPEFIVISLAFLSTHLQQSRVSIATRARPGIACLCVLEKYAHAWLCFLKALSPSTIASADEIDKATMEALCQNMQRVLFVHRLLWLIIRHVSEHDAPERGATCPTAEDPRRRVHPGLRHVAHQRPLARPLAHTDMLVQSKAKSGEHLNSVVCNDPLSPRVTHERFQQE